MEMEYNASPGWRPARANRQESKSLGFLASMYRKSSHSVVEIFKRVLST